MRWESRLGRRWRLRGTPGAPGEGGTATAALADTLAAALDLPPLVAEILARRGASIDAARRFFAAGKDALLDAEAMAGLPRAVERIEQALHRGEHVRLVTDYDVDGTTSCLVLHAALDRRIAALGSGARVSYHIPDRFLEGYGLSARAVDEAAAAGVGLLVTADIGVRDHASVTRARRQGVDVLVLDHHLPAGEDVPGDALAVLCPPQAGCGYANKALAACGVSLKLAEAILAGDPRRAEVLASMWKLVAIGTVADVVDLGTPENRALVTLGLDQLNTGAHGPGLQALLEVARLTPGSIQTADLGFRIGPRINAAGRLADANAVVRLLRERDPERARVAAAGLDRLNRERQGIQEEMVELALAQVGDDPAPFVVVHGQEAEGWHRGVSGVVASRLRDRLGRPVAVVSTLGGSAVGSVRSIPQVHAVRALDAAADLLTRYGGHPVAAGFSLPAEMLPAFTERVQAFVASHTDGDLTAWEEVDAVLDQRVPPLALAEALRRFEPCGKGNPTPLFVAPWAAAQVRVVKDKHLFFRVGPFDAVWWGGAEHRPLLEGAQAVLGTLVLDTWNGRTSARLVAQDVA